MDSVHDSHLFFVPLKDDSVACNMAFSIIMDESKLPSQIVPYACCAVSWLLVNILDIWKTLS